MAGYAMIVLWQARAFLGMRLSVNVHPVHRTSSQLRVLKFKLDINRQNGETSRSSIGREISGRLITVKATHLPEDSQVL